jgi:cell wall-associated NlpC family hydrolase
MMTRMSRLTTAMLLVGVLLPAAAVTAATWGSTYVVRPGDTLYQISLRYGVSADAIAATNSLGDASRIIPGQVLKIPRQQTGPGIRGTSHENSTTSQPALIAVHRVRSGDTLLGLAWRYGVPVEAIKQANGLWTTVILPGQQLAIPTRGAVAALARRHAPVPQPIPVPQVAFQRTVKAGSRSARILEEAMRFLGVRYVWGGTSESGLDCSGLIYRVFARYVPTLARLRTYDYFQMGKVVVPQAMLPGDLVFFTTDDPGPSHVGIFLGDGKFIHASSVANGVTIASLDDPSYGARFLGARRLVDP